jgi:epoxyqueuosine reductase
LQSIKNEIEFFKENEELNGFQKWIVDDLYKFDVPTLGFTVRSIILVAIAHPSYAEVEFTRQGKKYVFPCLMMSEFEKTDKYLNDFLTPKNYNIKSAPNLPMKRLSAQSGLAVYGRNNICYIEGMGSFFTFAAYFSDIECDNDAWTQMQHADTCTYCSVCLSSCPTGAILDERFLIDNERCLSFINENVGEFPEWIPITVHHCIYDCLICQINCPMNIEYVNNVIGSFKFSEDETEMLLSGISFDKLPPALRQKSKLLGLNAWYGAIPRNLKVLFELSDRTSGEAKERIY